MEPLVVIVVIVAFAIGKWLFENAGESQGKDAEAGKNTQPEREQRPVPSRPLRPDTESMARGESEEEKMRRFMEALGLPPQGAPPPPARKPAPKPAPTAQRPAYNPLPAPKPHPRQLGRPIHPSSPGPIRKRIAPPLETGEPLPTLPKTASVSESAPSMEVASIPRMTYQSQQAVQSAGAEVSGVSVQPGRSATKKQQPSASSALREQLRDPASVRKAILLREILGPPKGLQSGQTPSIFSPL